MTVRLETGLSGPFGSVNELKASSKSPSITAPVVLATVPSTDNPVSVIRIPADAAPGFYDLTATATHDGISFSGGSVIRVEPE